MTKTKSTIVWKTVTYILLVLGSIMFILPFVWMVSTSFKTERNALEYPPKWIPSPATLNAYKETFDSFPFLIYLRNTVIVTFFATLGVVVSSCIVAYGFARFKFKGRDFLFVLLLSTMMLPAQVTMIPVFLLFRTLGWVDTFLPLTVPKFFGVAFFIFLLRQYFMTIPRDLIDAARIDGASEFGILMKIMVPLSKPAIATVVIFSFMANWNDFLGPLIYLNSENMKTLALGLQSLQTFYGSRHALMMAASVLMVIPVILLFFFTQKHFVKGITLTGMKG